MSKTITEQLGVDSVIRPFIADNLARGRLWFEGFARWLQIMRQQDSKKSRKQHWEKIQREREGIRMMVNDKEGWKQQGMPAGARSLVLAVRDALQSLYKTIETDRKEREYDKWRIAFSGAKTAERFRYTLTNMFSRARFVPALHNHWWDIVELMACNWELARDLALVGLACEAGKKDETVSEQNTAEELATEESNGNE